MTTLPKPVLIIIPPPPGRQGCRVCASWSPGHISLFDKRCKGCGEWYSDRGGIVTRRESTSRQKEYCCQWCEAMPFGLWFSDRLKRHYKRKAARQRIFGPGLDQAITLAPVVVDAEFVQVLEDRKYELSPAQIIALFRS
jgi:hypothetical protein